MTDAARPRENLIDRLLRARPATSAATPTLAETELTKGPSSRADDEARPLQLAIAVIARDEDEWRRLNRETWTTTAEAGGLRAVWYLLGGGYPRARHLAAQIEKDPQTVLTALQEQLAILKGAA